MKIKGETAVKAMRYLSRAVSKEDGRAYCRRIHYIGNNTWLASDSHRMHKVACLSIPEAEVGAYRVSKLLKKSVTLELDEGVNARLNKKYHSMCDVPSSAEKVNIGMYTPNESDVDLGGQCYQYRLICAIGMVDVPGVARPHVYQPRHLLDAFSDGAFEVYHQDDGSFSKLYVSCGNYSAVIQSVRL